MGAAYEDSYIEGPVGQAKRDFEEWLVLHPEIRHEVNEKIRMHWNRMCLKEEEEVPQIEGFTAEDMEQLRKIANQHLFSTALVPYTPPMDYGPKRPGGLIPPDLLDVLAI